MSDEVTAESVAIAVAPKRVKAPKKNFYKDKADKLAAEVTRLKSELETQSTVKDHFEKIEGFVDEHDRAKLKHKEQIQQAKERGVDPDEIIETGLDSSEVRGLGYEGKEWVKGYRLRWVNNTSRKGARISYHKGKGFFFVRPSEHPVRPTHGIKEEDTWILGECVLMAEPIDIFIRSRGRALEKMLHQAGEAREGTREQINQLIRDESGLPNARPGITKSYRDNTWDRVEEGPPVTGPSAHTITPAA